MTSTYHKPYYKVIICQDNLDNRLDHLQSTHELESDALARAESWEKRFKDEGKSVQIEVMFIQLLHVYSNL